MLPRLTWYHYIKGSTILLLLQYASASNDNDDGETVLEKQDFERALSLRYDQLFDPGAHQPVWEQRNFHGDIAGRAASSANNLQVRNGVRLQYDKWPEGEIPYTISLRYSPEERAILARAIQAYHDRTCIRFIPRNGHKDYIFIGKIDGCFSDVGRAGGRQEVSLSYGCIEYDTAIHELMHAVGFWHEHERWDREDFLRIMWDNVDESAYDQFGKVNLHESDYYGEGYDYLSIMHYDSKSFTKNGRNTMEARDNRYTYRMGRQKDFSDIDLRKINKMYSCGKHLSTSVTIDRRPISRGNRRFEGPRNIPVPKFVNQDPNAVAISECEDKAELCHKWNQRCTVGFFKDIMEEYCAKTCGFCGNGKFRHSEHSWMELTKNFG